MSRGLFVFSLIFLTALVGHANAQWKFKKQNSFIEKKGELAEQYLVKVDYKQHKMFKSFQRYEAEYCKLDEQCVRITPRGTMALINVTHCVWRKDQILMSKYELDHLLFDLAAERYEKTFQLAKTTSIQALGGNTAALIDDFVQNKIHNDND